MNHAIKNDIHKRSGMSSASLGSSASTAVPGTEEEGAEEPEDCAAEEAQESEEEFEEDALVEPAEEPCIKSRL